MNKNIKALGLLVILFLAIPVSAYDIDLYDKKDNSKFWLFIGSSADFKMTHHEIYTIHFHDTYQRRVTVWILKNGELIDAQECYKVDICYLKYAKIKIDTVFYGKESSLIIFKFMQVY